VRDKRPISALNAPGRVTRQTEGIPRPTIKWNPAAPKTEGQELRSTPQPADEDLISEQEWGSLLRACRKARLHPMQTKRLIADAAGIPVYDVGVIPLNREQYRQVVSRLEECRSKESSLSDPRRESGGSTTIPSTPAQITGDDGRWEGSLEQIWDAFYKDCRELGLERWQAQQVITEVAGIPPDELDNSRPTRHHLQQVYERLEDLEKEQLRIPLSPPPPADPKQISLSWDAPELPHKFRLKGSGIPWAEPFQGTQGGIPPWRWDGYWCEEDREDK